MIYPDAELEEPPEQIILNEDTIIATEDELPVLLPEDDIYETIDFKEPTKSLEITVANIQNVIVKEWPNTQV